MEERKELLTKSGIYWINTYYELEDCILIKIYRKDNTESFDCYIDKEDYNLVSKYQWHVVNKRKFKRYILNTIEHK